MPSTTKSQQRVPIARRYGGKSLHTRSWGRGPVAGAGNGGSTAVCGWRQRTGRLRVGHRLFLPVPRCLEHLLAVYRGIGARRTAREGLGVVAVLDAADQRNQPQEAGPGAFGHPLTHCTGHQALHAVSPRRYPALHGGVALKRLPADPAVCYHSRRVTLRLPLRPYPQNDAPFLRYLPKQNLRPDKTRCYPCNQPRFSCSGSPFPLSLLRSLDWFVQTELLVAVGAPQQAGERVVGKLFEAVEWFERTVLGWTLPGDEEAEDATSKVYEVLQNYTPPEAAYTFAQLKWVTGWGRGSGHA